MFCEKREHGGTTRSRTASRFPLLTSTPCHWKGTAFAEARRNDPVALPHQDVERPRLYIRIRLHGKKTASKGTTVVERGDLAFRMPTLPAHPPFSAQANRSKRTRQDKHKNHYKPKHIFVKAVFTEFFVGHRLRLRQNAASTFSNAVRKGKMNRWGCGANADNPGTLSFMKGGNDGRYPRNESGAQAS